MSAVDLAAPHHHVGGGQVDQIVATVIFGLAGDTAEFAEGILVEQPFDTFAHREPATIVLALHLVGAAHPLRHLLTAAQLVHFRLPAHDGASSCFLFVDDTVNQVLFVESDQVDTAWRARHDETCDGALQPCFLVATQRLGFRDGDRREADRLPG